MVQWYFLFIGDTEGKDFAPPTSDNISELKCFMILIWASYCNERKGSLITSYKIPLKTQLSMLFMSMSFCMYTYF